MFIKPFKLKSCVQVKASDCKKLKTRIQNQFDGLLTDSDILNLFPNKSAFTLTKIITYNGSSVQIYSIDKRPMFFEEDNDEKLLIPTLYTLWMLPNFLPYFTTHKDVLPRLANGADLMLPGVIKTGTGLNTYGHYKKNELVAVNLTNNSAAVGIGRLMRSSYDLYMSGGQGPCVKILHIFGDKLWGIDTSIIQQIPILQPVLATPTMDDFPALGSTSQSKAQLISRTIDDFPALGSTSQSKAQPQEKLEVKLDDLSIQSGQDIDETEIKENETDETSLLSTVNDMDNNLKSAFLTALKTNARNLPLPILTSNFYRNYIIPSSVEEINLKKTSYKKISKFLDQMSSEGFLVVREETKGVEKIISIDFQHPELLNFIRPNTEINEKTSFNENKLFHTEMMELYQVTDETIKFFTKYNYSKGDSLPLQQIKKMLKDYISKYQIKWIDQNKKILKLDECLTEICDGKVESTLDECYKNLIYKMKQSFEMRAKNDINSNKPPIQMSLATRSGNKKVTLITNLESYGIILSEFSKACKQGAAASTSIIKSPNQKQDIFQIQGNQIKFLHKLLVETYKINEKNIHGLDLARKEKKIKK